MQSVSLLQSLAVGATAFFALFAGLQWLARRQAEAARDSALGRAAKAEAEVAVARAASDADRALAKGQAAMEGALSPVREALERVERGTREMEKERQRSYALVESELKRVAEAGGKLAAETAALKNALKKPHVRGRWGEAQLKNCIELAGMSEYADVSLQSGSRDDGGSLLVPDMTVRMPGGRVVVVDAKTPLDAFLASIEAEGDEARAAELARHGRHLREHVKRLATRAYAEQIKGSADFAILFLPNESFLYAALESQPDIMEFALEKKILIATPPTLIGLLKVIRFGWNEERVARNAEAIAEAGRKLHKRLASFVEAFDGIGKHLDRARAEYETGAKRLQGQVLAQARKMEELGGIGTNEPEAAIALPHGDSPFLAQAPEASLAKAEAAASGL